MSKVDTGQKQKKFTVKSFIATWLKVKNKTKTSLSAEN